METPALIALDWGTSNLRASLLDAGGTAIDTRSASGGVMAVQGGRFAEALLALCGDWITRFNCPLMASGMVGSRQGWKEAPYLACPAGLAEAAQQLTTVVVDPGTGRRLHIAPGLQCTDAAGQFDVMRGEETQIWGAQLPDGTCCVLPGTHSKWAWLGSAGVIREFRSFMTGELFGLLTQHGILGRLMVFGQPRPGDFIAGVRLGLQGHAALSHTIFAARTAGLMGQVAPEGLPDYLSGILIGGEIGAATRALDARLRAEGVVLIGDDDLCSRYTQALEVQGIASRRAPAGTTTTGQWRIARAGGLVAGD
ncbi:MAG: 2-dehydro-3-deoxygalactonokinase [Rhodoferax sp.]